MCTVICHAGTAAHVQLRCAVQHLPHVLAACTTAGGAQPGSTALQSRTYLMGANTQMMTTNSHTADIQAAAGTKGWPTEVRLCGQEVSLPTDTMQCGCISATTPKARLQLHLCVRATHTFVFVGQGRAEMLLRK